MLGKHVLFCPVPGQGYGYDDDELSLIVVVRATVVLICATFNAPLFVYMCLFCCFVRLVLPSQNNSCRVNVFCCFFI